MYKLNDFNRARFITWDIVKKKPCPFFIPKSPGRCRSPEEYYYEPLTEKIDVYSLGNVLYTILTRRVPFHKKSTNEAIDLVKDGKKPHIPLEKDGPENAAIIEAIHMCWTKDPKDRSSAREVDLFLRKKLQELNVTAF